MKKACITGVVVAVMLGILAVAGHRAYWRSPAPDYLGMTIGPSTFVPSAMYALGYGLRQTDCAASPGLAAFFNEKEPSLDLSRVDGPLATVPLDEFSLQHRYLIASVGVLWRVTGIRWDALEYIELALYLAAALGMFGLFRLVSGRVTAAVLTALFMASPEVLEYMGQIRDFSRAPFLLAAMWMWARLVCGPPRGKGLLFWGAGLGLIAGIGIGFRYDVRLAVAASVGILCFVAAGSFRRNWHWRVLSVAALIGCFTAAGWPILEAGRASGTASYHHAIKGLAEMCDNGMGLGPASYSRMAAFCDDYSTAAADARYRRGAHAGEAPLRQWLSPRSAAAKRAYFLDMLRTFPGDMLGRGYAALLTILRHGPSTTLVPWLLPFPVVFFVCGLGMLARRRPRYAWALLIVSLYFAGSASLQFDVRHYFYLGFLPLWCLALLVTGGRRKEIAPNPPADSDVRQPDRRSRSAKRLFWFAAVAAAAIGIPLWAGRAAQDHSVRALRAAFSDANLVPVRYTALPLDTGSFVYVHATPGEARALDEESWDCIAIEFAAGAVPPRIEAVYSNELHPSRNLNFTMEAGNALGESPGAVRCFLPVFRCENECNPSPWHYFLGFGLPGNADGIRGVWRVRDVAALPLPVGIAIPERDAAFRTHQRLPLWRRPDCDYSGPFRSALPSDTVAARLELLLQGNDRVAAVDLLATALEGDSDDPETAYRLGALNEAYGNSDQAIASYRQAYCAAPEYLKPRRALDAALRQNAVAFWRARTDAGDGAAAWHSLGMAYEKQFDTSGAVDAFTQARRLDPGSRPVAKALARALAATKQYAAAAEVYRDLLARYPADAGLYVGLGEMALVLGNHEDAAGHARRAFDALEPLIQDLPLAGDIYSEITGLFGDAALLYETAAECSLDNGDTAQARTRLNEIDRILETLLHASFPRESLGERFVTVELKQAELRQRLSPDIVPLALYLAAIATTPKDFETARRVDEIVAQHQTPEKRAAFWDTVAVQLPEALYPSYFGGMTYFSRHEYREAAERFRRALALKSDAAFTVGFLGWCELELGRCEEAAAALGQALALAPDAAEFAAPLERARECQ